MNRFGTAPLARLLIGFLAALTALSMSFAAAPDAHASGWMYPQAYWSSNGSDLHVWGKAYVHDYGCGLKDCADGSHHYVQAGRLSGAYASNLVRASSSMKFTGSALSVSVSASGASAGFSSYNDACSHGWWNGGHYWVSVDFGTANICHTSTWGWVSSMITSVTGGVRFGTAWTVRSGSASVKVGGF